MKLNKHYSELNESYLFSTIAHKVAAYQKANPDKDIIRLGICDVTLPLAKSVTNARLKAVEEQGKKESFHGYIPSEQGYEFLRSAIQKYYAGNGVELDMAEIFLSEGAKSDLGNLLDLFDVDNTVLVPDPVYPTYVDDNVTDGRKIIYSRTGQENGFLGMPDENVKADIIYICSPNNPTGATYTVEQLKDMPNVPICSCGGVIKPDVVLYEEGLDADTLRAAITHITRADMLIVGGTSLNVYPASGLIDYYKGNKLALINKREPPSDYRADLIITDSIGMALDKATEGLE